MRLGVVVPTLNEARAAPALVRALRRQRGIDTDIVVADGGSHDDTVEACRRAGARVLCTAPGRGRQMNAGAAAVRGDWLLFLHADSGLRSAWQLRRALDALQAEAERLGHDRLAGHFALRFVRARRGHARLYRFLQAKSASGRPWTINGDQGLLLSRRYFRALGGFDESLPIFEDQRIAARIFATGHWRLLPDPIETSARRFEQGGPVRTHVLMGLLLSLHAAGADEYLAQARRLYPSQPQPPDLLACAALAARTLVRRREPARLAARLARFAAGNAWQLPLLLRCLVQC